MIKKSLIAITVVALLAVSAQAFDGKIHWEYEQIPIVIEYIDGPAIPLQVGTYDVMFHIPYYAIIEPQDGEIELEQTEGLTFCGAITIEAAANFDATLTCEVVPNATGLLIQEDLDKWTCSVSDGSISANAAVEEQTITVCVEDADVMVGLPASTTSKVAEVNLFIAPL